MTDITKEQIEKFRDVTLFMFKEWAGALADKNTSSFDYTNLICDLALHGLEATTEIERLLNNGEKLLSETLNMADKAQTYEKDLSTALNRVKELEAGLSIFTTVIPRRGENYEPAHKHGVYITIGELRRAAELLKGLL